MNRQIVGAAKAILSANGSVKNLARNSSHYKPPANWYNPTLSELPIPQGSWQAAHNAQQKKNNLHLAVGIGFFVFTLTVLKTSGLVSLNSTIPSLPQD